MEKQTKTWFIRGLLLLIILTMSCTCVPGSNNNNIVENDVPDVTVAVEINDTATPMPTRTDVVVVEDTLEPTLDEAAAATELAELLEDYSQTMLRDWSVPSYPESVYLADERDEDPDAEAIVERDARIFAVEEPYYYEFYSLPGGLRFADVKDYFMVEIPAMGYKVGSDLQGSGQEIYILTFVDDSSSPQRKIIVEYWRNDNLLLLLYKNPE